VSIALGAVDGGDHLGIGLFTVDQRRHGVAGRERPVGHPVDELRQRVEVAHLVRQRGPLGGRQHAGDLAGADERPLGTLPGGLAPDAVDAEQGVQRGAHDRGKPDQAHPCHGGAAVPLVQHDVRRGDQGQQHRQDDGDCAHGLDEGCEGFHGTKDT
jgi:hypothetical protein